MLRQFLTQEDSKAPFQVVSSISRLSATHGRKPFQDLHLCRTLHPKRTTASMADWCIKNEVEDGQEDHGSWEVSAAGKAFASLGGSESELGTCSSQQVSDDGLNSCEDLGSLLVSVLRQCGDLSSDPAPSPNLYCHASVDAWTTFIRERVACQDFEQALDAYKRMHNAFIRPSKIIFPSLLKACAELGCREKGQELHTEIAHMGFETDLFVGSALVHMYAKWGLLVEAQDVFSDLPRRDVVLWTVLIAGYAKHNLDEQALNCFQHMQSEGVIPNVVTFVYVLKACSSRTISSCQQMHIEIAKEGFEKDSVVANVLVDLYAQFGWLVEAHEVLHEAALQNVVTWTMLIAEYANHGFGEEALRCLNEMYLQGLCPNVVTFMCTLKACKSLKVDRVCEIHMEVVKQGFEGDTSIGCSLIDLYTDFMCLREAQDVFDKLNEQDVIAWTTLIMGYVEQGLCEEALSYLEQMQLKGVSPNAVTYVCILKGLGHIGAINKGQAIHAEIAGDGLEDNTFVGNTLVAMYLKCGALADARDVFDDLQVRNVVSWNSLIAGYVDHGLDEEALNCLGQMELEDVAVNSITLASSLKACSSLGATIRGQQLHVKIIKKAFEKLHTIGNTLVDMYGKCGLLVEAEDVFGKLPKQDVVSFTALIDGYACQGETELVFRLLGRMIDQGIQPDGVTFLSVLNACNHSGLLDLCFQYFEVFSKEYSISPTAEHHNCMADALGRAGCFSELLALLERMPLQPNVVMWITVLGACWKSGYKELGRHAFESAGRLDEKHSTPFVLMSNIISDAYLLEDEFSVKVMDLT